MDSQTAQPLLASVSRPPMPEERLRHALGQLSAFGTLTDAIRAADAYGEQQLASDLGALQSAQAEARDASLIADRLRLQAAEAERFAASHDAAAAEYERRLESRAGYQEGYYRDHALASIPRLREAGRACRTRAAAWRIEAASLVREAA